MRRGAGWMLVGALAWGAAAGAQDEPDAAAAQAESDAAAETPQVELVPVPPADLGQLEDAVATQLAKMQAFAQSIATNADSNPAQRADAFGEMGRLYHAYELMDSAEACYKNAAALAPREARWPYLRAHLLRQSGILEEAAELYQRALELDPSIFAARVHLGETYVEMNRPEEARTVLEQALEAVPESPAALAALGQVALAEKDHRQAVEHLEAALELAPQANRLHHPLGLAYRGLGEMDEARQHLAARGLVGVRPDDPLIDALEGLKRGERVQLLRGRMAFRVGHYAEAIDAFGLAVEAAPESIPARANLATALATVGQTEAALEHFEQVLASDPDNRAAHYNLGMLLQRAGKLPEAAEHLAVVLEADPADLEARLGIAQLLRRAGRLQQASEEYGRALQLDPANGEAMLGQAELLVQVGRFEDAAARLAAAREMLPEDGRLAHAHARLLASGPDPAMRDGETALALAMAVYEVQGTVRHAETVALALAELERCDEAAEWQRAALAGASQSVELTRIQELSSALARYEQERPCRPPVAAPPP